jgi:1-acyl-sn-glycerol-3-phosphate acyltransferase
MPRVLVIESCKLLGEILVERLRASPAVEACHLAPHPDHGGFGEVLQNGQAGFFQAHNIDTVVYAPPSCGRKRATPDLDDARRIFRHCASTGIKKVAVLSSAAIYGPHCHNQGLMAEDRLACRHRKNETARQWWELEALAREHLGDRAETQLTILRPASVPLRDAGGPLSGLFQGPLTLTLAGYDPSIQLLSPEDLARAIRCAVEAGKGGVYNVAPAGVVSLRQALRLAGSQRVPIPYLLQRALRAVLSPLDLAYPGNRTEYLRYSWTVGNEKITTELGFIPQDTSTDALCAGRSLECGTLPKRWREFAGRRPDDFGLDEKYFAFLDRTLVKFLERYYWRVEARGLEHIPRQGRAVLVGVHRGFMPFDGVITAHLVAREAGRIPRFLTHPGLVKFPFLHNFMIRQGGIIACNENADYILKRDGLLAIYPEGIHGAFRLYREAYQLAKFGRDEYVRMALRNRAPIIPFVTLGSAEIFPILAKIEWSWWKRYSEWPFVPVTPTFPLLPVPLPSKWHMLFLEPVHVEQQYPPEAADDNRIVQSIGQEIRRQMQETLSWMRGRRRSIFFGSILGKEPAGSGVAAGAETEIMTPVQTG